MPNIKYIHQDREQTIDSLTELVQNPHFSPADPKQSPTSNSIQPYSSILPNTHNTPRTSSRPFYPITRIQENNTPKTTKQCTLCPYLILSHLIYPPSHFFRTPFSLLQHFISPRSPRHRKTHSSPKHNLTTPRSPTRTKPNTARSPTVHSRPDNSILTTRPR